MNMKKSQAFKINQNPNHTQQVVIELVETGVILGSVLEVNSGTGENALHIASAGFPTLGIVLDKDEFILARQKAQVMLARRGMCARFMMVDPLNLDSLKENFFTIVDTDFITNLNFENKHVYLESIQKLLETEGSFILLLPNKKDVNGLKTEEDVIRWSDLVINHGFVIDKIRKVTYIDASEDLSVPGWVIIFKKVEKTSD